MGNFTTTKKEYLPYAKLANSAESLTYSDPRSSLTIFGTFAEQLTQEIFRLDGLDGLVGYNVKQKERIDTMRYSNVEYPEIVLQDLDIIRKKRNRATHQDAIEFQPTQADALKIGKSAYVVWSWFMGIFSHDEDYDPDHPKPYQKPVDMKQILADKEDEVAKLKAQIAKLQAQPIKVMPPTPEQKEKRHKITVRYAKLYGITESQTRELIDDQLRNAGWEVDTEKLNNWKNGTLPKKGHNMAIAEWVLPNKKRADYALFIGKELVGVIEAKRWDDDIAGQLPQAKEYSRAFTKSENYQLIDQDFGDYKAPFIYAANGRPYTKQYEEKSGIWFWDARNPMENSYALEEFHSPEDLKLKLTAVKKKDANKSLAQDEEYPAFANRYYQIAAVKALENGIQQGKKRMLLEMSTGTGKTRTAMSLMYRLLKHKRARRILYLVDRNSLGRQTANAIKDNKVGNYSLSSIYGMKELTDKLPDASTKIQIATVQGMIKRLFYSDDGKMEKPSVGMYDFIIVDEAHRGYAEDRQMAKDEYRAYNEQDYISQYRRVIDYFDATVIGMTATPALQTVNIFGHPVYSYSYMQGVLDGVLVDHNAPHIIQTKLSQEGIKFKKGEVDVFDETSKSVKKEELPDNMNFELKDFNKKVITRSFNEVVCDYLAKKLDPTNPKQGKTLIFAANDAHADMVVDLLKKAFKKAGNPVNDDAIEKITGYLRHPDEEIRRYKNEEFPNIAVTVDLLTTGIDVPAISNLVFLRQVKSRILYEQMLGRATRLCPEINKDHFEIYDAVGIYDAMNKVTDMKPVVKDPNHNVHYYVTKKHELFEVSDHKLVKQYQTDMSAAVERKIKRLPENAKKEFEHLNEVNSIDKWAASLSKMDENVFMDQWDRFKNLDKLKSIKPKQYISNEEDELVDVKRGYGNGNVEPKDYIESFNDFIKKNVNEIPALNIIATRPRDLTLKELKQIKLKLEQQGYKENSLQTAWKNANHVQTTADIISFIRQAAIGSPLVDHETRIRNAMQKIYGMADWSAIQKKWLRYIENQLIASSVLGPNAQEAFNSNNFFKRNGGYKRLKKLFPDQIDEIVKTLNDNLYA